MFRETGIFRQEALTEKFELEMNIIIAIIILHLFIVATYISNTVILQKVNSQLEKSGNGTVYLTNTSWLCLSLAIVFSVYTIGLLYALLKYYTGKEVQLDTIFGLPRFLAFLSFGIMFGTFATCIYAYDHEVKNSNAIGESEKIFFLISNMIVGIPAIMFTILAVWRHKKIQMFAKKHVFDKFDVKRALIDKLESSRTFLIEYGRNFPTDEVKLQQNSLARAKALLESGEPNSLERADTILQQISLRQEQIKKNLGAKVHKNLEGDAIIVPKTEEEVKEEAQEVEKEVEKEQEARRKKVKKLSDSTMDAPTYADFGDEAKVDAEPDGNTPGGDQLTEKEKEELEELQQQVEDDDRRGEIKKLQTVKNNIDALRKKETAGTARYIYLSKEREKVLKRIRELENPKRRSSSMESVFPPGQSDTQVRTYAKLGADDEAVEAPPPPPPAVAAAPSGRDMETHREGLRRFKGATRYKTDSRSMDSFATGVPAEASAKGTGAFDV